MPAPGLTLTLFETGVLLVDNIELALPSHNLAIRTTFLNGCTNFHDVYYLDLNMPFTYTGI
jgi:hypothetical protein